MERYPMHQSLLEKMPVHKFIPMEKLDLIQSNQVRILYYQNPSRFYVYLREKINSHAQFQVELQRAMQNYQPALPTAQYQLYQPVVAQDNHAIWHRATILDFNTDSTELCVYFVDVGQEENISITNIRPLPSEFIRRPAFAIPCRLFKIYPLHGNEESTWKLDDPVHDEFNRQMSNNANCKVNDIKDQKCYDVEIDIPKVGDLGTYLCEQNLVSRTNMRTTQPTPQSSGRIPSGFSGLQQPIARLLQKPIVQQSPTSTISSDSSSDISTLPPQDGNYIITQVYSAIEFYGHSQVREKELDAFHKHLETIYNNNTNDQSLSVHFLMDGVPCAVQQGEKYHRVIIKHRESESRVLVKLVDRGDVIIVDTSELLQLEKKYFTIPAFAQPFRLYNYDESHSTATITRKLKKLILNQRVSITQHLPVINGFHPVEVKLSDNQSVNQILLSNDINPIIAPPVKPAEIQTIKPQQINEDLPAPQKLLTAPPPPPSTNRFVPNEQTSRFGRPQQQDESNSPVNGHQSLMSEQNRPFSRGFPNEQNANGNNNREGRNNDGQRSGGFNRNGDSFGDQNNDDNSGRRTGGFNRRDGDDNSGQRPGGFNRNGGGGGGFADRGNRNGFGDRNNENRNENNGQRTGGFNYRGARNGDFQDRNNRYRNNQDDDNNENNSTPRFGNRGGFNGERRDRNGGGGFQNHRDRDDDREGGGDNGRRGGFGDRGYPRGGRGGFGDRGGPRGGRGGFGDRGRGGRPGGFGDRNENDNIESTKTFSGWPNIKPQVIRFEAGDQFLENEIPKESFQFVISHIENCNDFFIQLYSKENELSQLTETLQKEYKDAPELNTSSIKIDQACLAKSSDDCWYRAIVLSTGLTKIKVRFIDFGDTIDVDIKTIRQLANKFCLTPPYAYHCIVENVEGNENINTNQIIEKCADQRFNGKIEKKSSDNKYILQSDNFQNLMLDINAIQLKSPLKNNISCVIVYIDYDKHQFYIQDDLQTMKKITDQVTINNELLPDDRNINSMVISTFDNEPFRALIQSDFDDDNVSVYFVDYGNTNICSKSLLKKCNEQLKSYPYQAKRCQLYEISLNDIDQAYKQLEEYLESDKTEISIINQTKDVLHVRLYIDGECFNDKFPNEISIDLNDQSNATTVKEQERPINPTGKRNNDEILSPVGNSLSTTINTKRQKSESEMEGNSIKSHRGVLTYIDKNKPIVYLQLLPESESNLDQINQLIDTIVQEDKHESSYEIGDYVIAQFTEDDNHYRARIESYSSSTELYTVYFLDYGNIDENVPKDRLYSYSNELKEIESQIHGYSVENLSSIRSFIEQKLNDIIEFNFIDQTNSIIHFKLDHENLVSNQPKTLKANISGTNKDCFYIHILPDTDSRICEMDELLEVYSKDLQQSNSWKMNDLCIVLDSEQNQYFRGKILSNENEKYDIQCIDYGNILSNITINNLYSLPNNDLFKQNSLARECRLYGVNDKDQYKAIEEIIGNINPTERVTITVENDQNDQCMFVMLFRENNEIVNDRYIKQEIDCETKNAMSTNSSDSAIDTSNDQQIISPIGIPQAESTHQYGDTTNLTVSTINQTIDFGENDPSSSNTTIKDENDHDN